MPPVAFAAGAAPAGCCSAGASPRPHPFDINTLIPTMRTRIIENSLRIRMNTSIYESDIKTTLIEYETLQIGWKWKGNSGFAFLQSVEEWHSQAASNMHS